VGLLLVGDTNAPTNSVERDCMIQTSFILLVHGPWVHAWGWDPHLEVYMNNCTLLSSKWVFKRFLFTTLPSKVNSYWLSLPRFILPFHLSNFTHTSWTFLVFLLDLNLRLCVSPPLLEGWCPHQCLHTFENISPQPIYFMLCIFVDTKFMSLLGFNLSIDSPMLPTLDGTLSPWPKYCLPICFVQPIWTICGPSLYEFNSLFGLSLYISKVWLCY